MPNYDEKPYLKQHRFVTDRSEPLTRQLNLRVSESMLNRLKKLENYPELCRQAIKKALDELEQLDDQDD